MAGARQAVARPAKTATSLQEVDPGSGHSIDYRLVVPCNTPNRHSLYRWSRESWSIEGKRMTIASSASAEVRRRFGVTTQFHERGDTFAVTGVRGVDPETGLLGRSADEQFARAFSNAAAIAEIAELSLSEFGRVTVFTPDPGLRPLINPPWLKLFPDAADRPARKTTHVPLAEGVHVELEIVGVRGATRTSIEISGVRHRDPLPMGARLGRYVYSSVIGSDLPNSGRAVRVAAIQQVYQNTAAFMDAAGGTMSDIANVWTYLGMWDLHPEMVDTWVDNFPEEASRPSRKTFYYPRVDIQMQCEAVLGGTRTVLEIPGISHHDPIPMGAITSGTFTTSGVDGRDPATNREPRGVAAQAETTLDNLVRLLAQADGRTEQLFHVTALLGEHSYIASFLPAWRAMFPDPDSAPALQVMTLGLPARDLLVQVIARGVLASS
jgi:2-iminobutanoate/2-iminopropanoate deaminase